MAAAPAAARTQRNARALERARNSHTATTAAPKRARTAPAAPRRKSGPATRKSAATAVPKRTIAPKRTVAAPRASVAAAPALVARAAQGSVAVLLDRVLRGRAWVFIVGALLAGIVFLNVSVLELNRGIARSSAQAAQLERTNSSMRGRLARLDSAERIQNLAEARGYRLPLPGDVTYLRPGPGDGQRAAVRVSAPTADQGTTATADPTAPAQPTAPSAAPSATAAQTSAPVTATPVAPAQAAAPQTAAATPTAAVTP